MAEQSNAEWEKAVVHPEKVLENIKPGSRIFLGTGAAEPRTLVRHLKLSKKNNLRDLELIQLVSFGDTISIKDLAPDKYRLKTFFSGWVSGEAVSKGQVDLIPCRYTRIPALFESGLIPVDMAIVQITPPNETGHCSLGIAADVAKHAIKKADIVVGEINPWIPYTFGDTLVPISRFDHIISSDQPPIYFHRWPVDKVFSQIAENVASVIHDGSCIPFSIGPLFEALSQHLTIKKDLGIHSPFITDALVDLIKSGAVTNENKSICKGKSLASYALGTPELMNWLDRNPLVEIQGIDKVFSPIQIGQNLRFIAIIPARKVDLSGRIALHLGKRNVAAGPGEVMDFFNGAEISAGGFSVFALPSRDRNGESNIRISVEEFPNLFGLRESVDIVVTEHGVADLRGSTIRERAQYLIDIAHPDDRMKLVEQAREARILYQDQVFIADSVNRYPSEIQTRHTFKDELEVRFRAIKPSDEEKMRRFFYRLSQQAVYYRYFTPLKTMPHFKIQKYVNVDYDNTLSIVGLIGEPDQDQIIAEARYGKIKNSPYADPAIVVVEKYQKVGIGTFLYKMLIQQAKERGVKGFTGIALSTNKGLIKILEKGGFPMELKIRDGESSIFIPFDTQADTKVI